MRDIIIVILSIALLIAIFSTSGRKAMRKAIEKAPDAAVGIAKKGADLTHEAINKADEIDKKTSSSTK